MKAFADFGRWKNAKAALAVLGALAIGGAVGSAVAISPSADAPVKWAGGWEYSSSGLVTPGVETLYIVPAGRNLMISDFTISNFSSSMGEFFLYNGSSGSCASGSKTRLVRVAVPPNGVTHLNYQTGIGFAAGTPVCINKNESLFVNARGFLFTAAPAS